MDISLHRNICCWKLQVRCMTTRYKESGIMGSRVNELTACILVLLLICIKPLTVGAQTGDDAVNALVKDGFENVGWVEDDEERIYVLQNSAYKLASVGIGKAIGIIQQKGLPEGKPCRIVVLDNNVPQVSMTYQPVVGDSVAEAKLTDWVASYEVDGAWKKVKKAKRKNSSLFKVDLVVYPQLYFKNLIITQIYQACFELSPALEVSLWPGSKLQLQVIFPVYNDGYGDEMENIRPGFLALEQNFRLPHNIFVKATVGTSNQRTFGADVRVSHPFKDDRFSVEARVGYVGVGVFNDFWTFKYSKEKICYWSAGGDFYWPYYNVQLKMRVEQYLKHDVGVKCEMIRHFKYASIGFYAEKSNKADANGGFRFMVALPPYKYKRHGYIPRVTTSHATGFVYNAGNEANYYLLPYASAGDNDIMKHNQYNPNFLNSYIGN